MGRVTLYMRPNCRYCVMAEELLRQACAAVVKAQSAEDAARPDAHINKRPEPKLEVLLLDVSKDASVAAQCIRFTNSRTVPQCFINRKYIGNWSRVEDMETSSKLEAALIKACRISTSFPPPPDAAMVKVTNKLAFSSLPTLSQVSALWSFGFKTLVAVCHPCEIDKGRIDTERAAAEAAGVTFLFIPPKTVVTPAPSVAGDPTEPSVGDEVATDKAVVESKEVGTMINTGEGEFEYTQRWIRNAVCKVQAAEPPVLVHCRSGIAAATVVLLHAALTLRATRRKVIKWGRDLGHDIEAHPQLLKCVTRTLAIAADCRRRKARAGCPLSLCAEVPGEDEDGSGGDEGDAKAGDSSEKDGCAAGCGAGEGEGEGAGGGAGDGSGGSPAAALEGDSETKVASEDPIPVEGS